MSTLIALIKKINKTSDSDLLYVHLNDFGSLLKESIENGYIHQFPMNIWNDLINLMNKYLIEIEDGLLYDQMCQKVMPYLIPKLSVNLYQQIMFMLMNKIITTDQYDYITHQRQQSITSMILILNNSSNELLSNKFMIKIINTLLDQLKTNKSSEDIIISSLITLTTLFQKNITLLDQNHEYIFDIFLKFINNEYIINDEIINETVKCIEALFLALLKINKVNLLILDQLSLDTILKLKIINKIIQILDLNMINKNNKQLIMINIYQKIMLNLSMFSNQIIQQGNTYTQEEEEDELIMLIHLNLLTLKSLLSFHNILTVSYVELYQLLLTFCTYNPLLTDLKDNSNSYTFDNDDDDDFNDGFDDGFNDGFDDDHAFNNEFNHQYEHFIDDNSWKIRKVALQCINICITIYKYDIKLYNQLIICLSDQDENIHQIILQTFYLIIENKEFHINYYQKDICQQYNQWLNTLYLHIQQIILNYLNQAKDNMNKIMEIITLSSCIYKLQQLILITKELNVNHLKTIKDQLYNLVIKHIYHDFISLYQNNHHNFISHINTILLLMLKDNATKDILEHLNPIFHYLLLHTNDNKLLIQSITMLTYSLKSLQMLKMILEQEIINKLRSFIKNNDHELLDRSLSYVKLYYIKANITDTTLINELIQICINLLQISSNTQAISILYHFYTWISEVNIDEKVIHNLIHNIINNNHDIFISIELLCKLVDKYAVIIQNILISHQASITTTFLLHLNAKNRCKLMELFLLLDSTYLITIHDPLFNITTKMYHNDHSCLVLIYKILQKISSLFKSTNKQLKSIKQFDHHDINHQSLFYPYLPSSTLIKIYELYTINNHQKKVNNVIDIITTYSTIPYQYTIKDYYHQIIVRSITKDSASYLTSIYYLMYYQVTTITDNYQQYYSYWYTIDKFAALCYVYHLSTIKSKQVLSTLDIDYLSYLNEYSNETYHNLKYTLIYHLLAKVGNDNTSSSHVILRLLKISRSSITLIFLPIIK